ncbi:MAG: CBS domain-containing protein [Acidimicrobiia bacterium]|nr:CBS domain-containing protein [Acidimicrobiia bacterium]
MLSEVVALAAGLVVGVALTLTDRIPKRLSAKRVEAPVASEHELIALTEAAAADDVIDDEERELIESVFALDDTIVREVMVPRTDMVAVASDLGIAAVVDLAIDKGLSRLPVFGDDLDDIVGVCLMKDLTRAERAGHGDELVATLMRRARFVPETKRAGVLLREMQAGRHPLPVAGDEYGGNAALGTLAGLGGGGPLPPRGRGRRIWRNRRSGHARGRGGGVGWRDSGRVRRRGAPR